MWFADEELAKSLFDSSEAAVNQIISVNEFSYIIGVYTSNEAKLLKPLGLVVSNYDQHLSQLNFNTDEISNIVFVITWY